MLIGVFHHKQKRRKQLIAAALGARVGIGGSAWRLVIA